MSLITSNQIFQSDLHSSSSVKSEKTQKGKNTQGTLFPVSNNVNASSTSATPPEPSKAMSQDDIKQDVSDLLKKNGFDSNDRNFETLLKEVLNKRAMILKVAERQNQKIDSVVLEKRLLNYAKASKFINFEKNALGNINSIYDSECSKAKSVPELREKYIKFGAEYAEYFDQDNDGKVNVHEMFYAELESYFQDKGLNAKDAKLKALSIVDKFKQYNATNLPKETDDVYGTEEHIQFMEVLSKVSTLDTDADNNLSKEEQGAYLLTMAQFDDLKNNITGQENIRTELAIAYQGCSVQDIMLDGFSETEAKNILTYVKRFNTQHQAATEFIQTGKFPE